MQCIYCKNESDREENFKQRTFINSNGTKEKVAFCLLCDEVYLDRFRRMLRVTK